MYVERLTASIRSNLIRPARYFVAALAREASRLVNIPGTAAPAITTRMATTNMVSSSDTPLTRPQRHATSETLID
jgi:hypothetical protein